MNKYILLLGSFLLSLIVTYLLEKKFIPFLMIIKMGQTILEIGPRWHKNKEGTPTMGGIFFGGGILASLIVFGISCAAREFDFSFYKVILMAYLFGCIGFLDDYVKFVKKRNKGLSVMQKLILQFGVSAGFLFSIKDSISTAIKLPISGKSIELGIFYWVFAILYIALMVNAVNLTDGIDGLCSSVSFVVFFFFSIIAMLGGSVSKAVFFVAICGGMIGFLIFNFYPARIFMGDTGSLFLGGALAGGAFWLNQPLIMAVAGFVFLFEAISVVLQVLSFKLTKKRIFKMAPFHHHLELCGWKEVQIVSFASLITAICCIVSYFIF